ncbi:MAG: thiamine-monophosphate kinase, partial [Verrucomicrobia bacterium]|nr:thiamine-monophosphate kinase [Verrucomicrobiota bacterium]
MKEFELIESLRPLLHTNPQTLVGAGDDCAVLDVGIPDRLLLFKTDAVVENVHFTRDAGWERIGRKA